MILTVRNGALVGLMLTNLFWASNAVIARWITDAIPPLNLAFYRWLLAALILLPFALPLLKKHYSDIRKNIPNLLLLGIMSIPTYNTVLYIAAHSTTAINIALVSSSLPLIALLFAWSLLGSRPTIAQCLGIVVSLLGVIIIITQLQPGYLFSLSLNRGDILIFGLACLWSLYSVLLKKYQIKLPTILLLWLLIVIGLPILLVLAFLESSSTNMLVFDTQTISVFIYTALFPSVLAYIFWNRGVAIVGPNIAAMSCYLMPLFAALIAIPLLGEKIYAYHILGGLLILIGLYFGSLYDYKKKQR